MLLQKLPTKLLGRPIETDFRKWMRFSVMWQSRELTVQEKAALSLLNVFGETPEDQEGALAAVLDFYLCGKEPGEPERERLVDWEWDGDCIWADFRMYAGINLHTAKLHWWEFMALFGSLPKDSHIKQRIEIRAMDLSKIKDPETRAAYQRAKDAVALDDPEDDWNDFYGRL